MIQLPIEPNLKSLQELFIFEFTKYQKIEYKDFELKLDLLNCLHEVNNIFESGDTLKFYSRDLSTKKEKKFTRYIFYCNNQNLFFVARLNDVETIYNFIGVNENFNRIFSSVDLTTRIYKVWKMPLKTFKTKTKKGSSNIDIKIFN